MRIPWPRSRLTLLVIAICGLAIVAGGAVLVSNRPVRTAASSIGGPFTLVNQDGRTVTQADFAGHPFIVFFGYTHCPDVCPTTLSDMSQMLNALGPGETLPALFVTVDPARDTPAVMKEYLSSFDARIIGLTGDPAAVTAAERAYRVYARQVPTTGGDYTMDHTAIVYLMDKDGHFVSALNLEQTPQAAAAEIKRDLS